MNQKAENTSCEACLMWLQDECEGEDIRDIVDPLRKHRSGEVCGMAECYEHGAARVLYVFGELIAVIDVTEPICYDLRQLTCYKCTTLNTEILNEFITVYGAKEVHTYRPI